jgi:predicted HicB family RNase H-like nuclease
MPESVVHFQIRMPPQQHEKLATWAKEDKISLNLLVVGILEKAMERHKSEAGSAKHSPSHAPK